MKRKKKYITGIKYLTIILLLAYFFLPANAAANSGDPVSDAKKGIVEIYSGFTDQEGAFHRMKYGSGFLVCNDEKGTVIVTNHSILESSRQEKEEYCAANGIAMENEQMMDVVRIVVRDDVTVEAAVVADSEEWNFSILSAGQVVGEKVPLELGDNSRLMVGDVVYALGYPDNPENLGFTAADAEIYQGNIQDKEAGQAGKSYLQHSARVSEGNAGGPLLDADGYVVGINCKEYSKAGSGRQFSIPVNAVSEVLDNFGIGYDSREEDELARNRKWHIITYILAGLILLLAGWLIAILVLNRRDKAKSETGEKEAKEKEPVQEISEEFYVSGNIEIQEQDETVVLPVSQDKKMIKSSGGFLRRTTDLKIIQIRTGRTVVMDKPEFMIGKSRELADFPVMENSAVSRRHAIICWREDEYFICDLGSSNGTYLQGERLSEGNPVKLKDGELVMLADEEFQLKIGKAQARREEGNEI